MAGRLRPPNLKKPGKPSKPISPTDLEKAAEMFPTKTLIAKYLNVGFEHLMSVFANERYLEELDETYKSEILLSYERGRKKIQNKVYDALMQSVEDSKDSISKIFASKVFLGYLEKKDAEKLKLRIEELKLKSATFNLKIEEFSAKIQQKLALSAEQMQILKETSDELKVCLDFSNI